MRIRSLRALDGPNVFISRPVLVMDLVLDDLAGRESREFGAFNERLLELLPGLCEHGCATGVPGAFVERMNTGTYFGHVVEHVALELSQLADAGVNYGKTIGTADPRVYQVIVEFASEPAMRFLLETAVELVDTVLRGSEYSLTEPLAQARRIHARAALGPSTRAIVAAAQRRQIPTLRLNGNSLVQLGYGKRRRLIQATMASTTSAVGLDIATDKQLTRELLQRAFIPVAQGRLAHTEAEAVSVLEDLGAPVAVKPQDGNQGRGVTLDVRTPEEMTRAFAAATRVSRVAIVEEMLEGRDYRVLVVGGRFVAASERVPPEIVGDGVRSIEQLVADANLDPRRGDGHDKPLTRIRMDEAARNVLASQGLTSADIPAAGARIRLRGTANLSTGGTAHDVTDLVHTDVIAMCERAARIVGLDICGIDLIAEDIARPLPCRGAGIVEINAGPGIRMHHHPSEGEPRDAGAAIVDMMFPAGEDGRIPIVSITGTNGKTTTARMVARAVSAAQLTAGLTTTDGVYIGGRQVAKGDMTGPRSARAVLCDPAVDVAVLETARGGIVRFGLGYDWSDVGVLTNVQLDHIGQDGIESIEDLLHIKSLVAERVREGGTLVLNADDENVAGLARAPRVRRIPRQVAFFSLAPHSPRVAAHISEGGTAYFPKNGWIVEARASVLEPVCRIGAIPCMLGGAAQFNLGNALAAVAAARALGLTARVIAQALETFTPEVENPGRANLYAVGRGYVLIDYGHNPAAIGAVGAIAGRWRWGRITGVVGLPGDRSNHVLRGAAAVAANVFDRIYVREDRYLRGRAPGEVPALIAEEIQRFNDACPCRIVRDTRDALREALTTMQPGELIVVFYEELDEVREILLEADASPVVGGLAAIARPSAKLVPRREAYIVDRRYVPRARAHDA